MSVALSEIDFFQISFGVISMETTHIQLMMTSHVSDGVNSGIQTINYFRERYLYQNIW